MHSFSGRWGRGGNEEEEFAGHSLSLHMNGERNRISMTTERSLRACSKANGFGLFLMSNEMGVVRRSMLVLIVPINP